MHFTETTLKGSSFPVVFQDDMKRAYHLFAWVIIRLSYLVYKFCNFYHFLYCPASLWFITFLSSSSCGTPTPSSDRFLHSNFGLWLILPVNWPHLLHLCTLQTRLPPAWSVLSWFRPKSSGDPHFQHTVCLFAYCSVRNFC